MEAIAKKNVEKLNLDPDYPCCQTNLWKQWYFGGVEPMPCQCHVPREIYIYSISMLHVWMGILKEFLQTFNHGYSHVYQNYSRNIVEYCGA